MTDEASKGLSMESWLLVVLVTSLVISGSFIALVSLNKEPVFSPYLTSDDQVINAQQIGDSRTTFGEDGMGYTIANTMSTPMLVNDWKDPHRTLLIIVAPEKPFDAAEASALHDFVTKKGGKVILASNSTNAQPVADLFGVKYFGDPVVDPYRYYEVEDVVTGQPTPQDSQRLWAVAGVTRNASEMGEAAKVACSEEQVNSDDVDNCRLPVLFHRPTAITVLEDQPEVDRTVSVLASASTPAFIASVDFNPDNVGNPILGEGKTGLIVRMDYPVGDILEQRSPEFGGGQGEINVTGSIVFVSDHSVFANHMWTLEQAEVAGGLAKLQCSSSQYEGREPATCWSTDSQGLSVGDTIWHGNERYFHALVGSMMEHDNNELASAVKRTNTNFNVVLDRKSVV